MSYTAAQLIDPVNVVYDEAHLKAQDSYQKAVQSAQFLNEQQKKEWSALGYVLTTSELYRGRKVILRENLRRTKTRRQLDKLKPTTEKK